MEGMKQTALQKLIDEPKGKIEYSSGEACILHVFWEAPSVAAAEALLDALKRCAVATHRDTPCVTTYFFRIANNNDDLCHPIPIKVGDHPKILEAMKKLRVGTPRPAVCADLLRKGIDPSLLDFDLQSDLPKDLQTKPVALEFTEVYLDERAFMEHAGSRDYLDAYGAVINPSFQNQPPQTIRLGTPRDSLVEKILDPILKERVAPLVAGCNVWRRTFNDIDTAIMLSLDVLTSEGPENTGKSLPKALLDLCATSVVFAHPMRKNTVRILCVLSALPVAKLLQDIADLNIVRGEAHIMKGGAEEINRVQTVFNTAGLSIVTVNASKSVGYILHELATALQPIMQST